MSCQTNLFQSQDQNLHMNLGLLYHGTMLYTSVQTYSNRKQSIIATFHTSATKQELKIRI